MDVGGGEIMGLEPPGRKEPEVQMRLGAWRPLRRSVLVMNVRRRPKKLCLSALCLCCDISNGVLARDCRRGGQPRVAGLAVFLQPVWLNQLGRSFLMLCSNTHKDSLARPLCRGLTRFFLHLALSCPCRQWRHRAETWGRLSGHFHTLKTLVEMLLLFSLHRCV